MAAARKLRGGRLAGLPRFTLRLFAYLLLAAQLLAGLALAWAVRDAPLEPGVAQGLLRADALSALLVVVAALFGLAELGSGNAARPLRTALAAALLAGSALQGHLLVGAGLLLAVALLVARRREQLPMLLAPALLASAGLALIGLRAGEWRYALAGAGLNSLSFAALLLAALLGAGAQRLVSARLTASEPLIALGSLGALLRLFGLGPWNTGWLVGALLLGGALALWAAWRAASEPPAEVAAWLGRYICGLVLVGAGLGSGAGLTLAGYALLVWPLLQLGLGTDSLEQADQSAARWSLWLLSGAVPFSASFVAAWMGVAAAAAGQVTLLAVVLWAAALLAALAVARLAHEQQASSETPRLLPQATVAATLSMALGIGSPAVVAGLMAPLVAQLQGGLTPFGELGLWPWAGILALDAARQPVAGLPSFAAALLMLVLAALCWVVLRLLGLRRRGQ